MNNRPTRLSKYLAKYLRHAPGELGLTLQPGVWVPVDDLLSAARRKGFPISYDGLVECVETNDKRRYSFDGLATCSGPTRGTESRWICNWKNVSRLQACTTARSSGSYVRSWPTV